MKEIEIFEKLTEATDRLFKNSDIYEKSVKNHWYWSVTATKFTPGKPLILGFNWGAAKGEKYKPQVEYPTQSFGELEDLGSFKRTIPYFEKYCPEALFGMMTNYCFFRSPNEKDISYNDLMLNWPLVDRILRYTKPSVIVSFSSRLRDFFIESGLTGFETKSIPNGHNILKILKTTFGTSGIPVYYLPHPNSPVTTEAREKCWEYCFNDEL